jgi:hypothetical protein
VLHASLVTLSIALIVVMEFFQIGPIKIFISQPLWNVYFIGLGGCEMKIFIGSSFYSSSNAKSGMNSLSTSLLEKKT